MRLEYNRKEHLRLLKRRHELIKNGKFLSDEDDAQLLHYSVQMSSRLHWVNRKKYQELISDFLNAKICGKQFAEEFKTMFIKFDDYPDTASYEEIKNFELSLNSFGFENVVYSIYTDCEEFWDEYNPENGFDPVLKTENQLRQAVESMLSTIQKYV